MRRSMLALAMAVLAGLCPALASAADPEMARKIAEALRASGQLTDYSIGVKFEDGAVLLMGRVASEEQMVRALALTESLSCVNQVINQLEIRPTATTTPHAAAAAESGSELELTAHGENLPHPLRGLRRPTDSPTAKKSNQPLPMGAQAPQAPRSQIALTSLEPGDPGDPLARTAQPAFSPSSSSRRYATEPQPISTVARSAAPVTAAPAPVAPAPIAAAPAAAPRPIYQTASNATAMASLPHHHHGGVMASGPAMPGCVNCGPGGGYESPAMPNHAWPSYASYPNYAAVTYPQQYSPAAWPYIGPFYPYPQVPLGWRKVTLEWDDGWWFLDFRDKHRHH